MVWNSEMKPAELLALLGILQRGFICSLGRSDRQRGDGDAPAVENTQAIDEPLAALTEQLRFREAAIGEHDFAGSAGAHSELVLLLADAEAGHSLFEDERGDAMLRRAAIGNRHGDADIGVLGIGSEDLAAVQYPAGAVLHGFGARSGGIGAGFSFSQRPGADPLASRQFRNVLLTLLVAAGDKNMIRA